MFKYQIAEQWDRVKRFKESVMSISTQVRRQIILIAIALLVVGTEGCVRSSIYEAVVKEAEVAKAEQQITSLEKETLTQQVKELEKLNDETIAEIERTLEAVQAVRRETERQKRESEANYGRLNHKIAQLAKRQTILRSELSVEKESSSGLKELVEVYKKKVREASTAVVAEIPSSEIEPITTPINPLKDPAPEALPDPITPSSPEQAVPSATPPLKKPVASPVKSSEPAESGWFSAITDWVLSVWRSLFS